MIPLPLDPAHCQARLEYWRGELDSESKRIAQDIREVKQAGASLPRRYWQKRHHAEQMVRAWEAVRGMWGGP